MKRLSAAIIASVASAVLVMSATPAHAHQHRAVGPFDTTVGWVEEPAFAGFRNAVHFAVERVDRADDHGAEADDQGHAEGRPVTNAELKVEVIFGLQDGTEKTDALDLEPAFGNPGEYRAFLVPTQPGTYTFHIFGTVGSRDFDEYYTSGEAGANDESEGTYNDMREPRDIQFPVKAPSQVELAAALDDARAAADSADSSASTATLLAIIALALAALAGIAGMAAGRRKAG
jgi:hypothetical protein